MTSFQSVCVGEGRSAAIFLLLLHYWQLTISSVDIYLVLINDLRNLIYFCCKPELFKFLLSDGHSLCSGVLHLNQQTASRSLDGIPASVQLLPRQTYLNVDEDAAGTLERKRNYIYCLIVHIMKQEKEMHIDNLVFKVGQRAVTQIFSL